MFGLLALGCAGAEPLMMLVRAVVTVRPRGLLNLSPAGLGRDSTTPGPTEAWFSFAVQEYASYSRKNKALIGQYLVSFPAVPQPETKGLSEK